MQALALGVLRGSLQGDTCQAQDPVEGFVKCPKNMCHDLLRSHLCLTPGGALSGDLPPLPSFHISQLTHLIARQLPPA